MTRHKVVLVPFPFDDLSSSKVRPAVCLTDPIGPHRHVVLAFISSRVSTKPLATDLVLNHHDTALIQRELGQLSPRLQAQVNRRLRRLFGLN